MTRLQVNGYPPYNWVNMICYLPCKLMRPISFPPWLFDLISCFCPITHVHALSEGLRSYPMPSIAPSISQILQVVVGVKHNTSTVCLHKLLNLCHD